MSARNSLSGPRSLVEARFAARNSTIVRAVFRHWRGSYFSGGRD